MAPRRKNPTTGKSASKGAPKNAAEGGFPSREQILAYIAEHPGEAGKRELARAFGIKGGARIALKHILRDLSEEGLVEKRGKRLARPGDLPSVTVVRVVSRDEAGEPIAIPVNWDVDEHGDPPRILVTQNNQGQSRGKRPGRAPGINDQVLVRIAEAPSDLGVAYLGRTIKVLEKTRSSALGVLRIEPDGSGRIVPVDRKQKELTVEKGNIGEAADGDLVAVEPQRSGRYGLPRAVIRERIGSMDSEKAISMIALHAHSIPHVFPSAVLSEAEEAKPATLAKREDWRKLPLVTIDPPDAKDHDDAVMGEPDTAADNPGGVIITVAIADVSWYVRPGSALDREALFRGNSVYFPDRVIPMLPERISNDLCSLREAEDRPAIAVRMIFDADGRKRTHSFHRVMMRSAARLSYQEAQDAVDGRPNERTEALVEPVLAPLWQAYAILKRGRDARQPLDLDLPERKIRLKPDGTVDDIYVPLRLDAHKLIEEFMIQANVAAAETLEKRKTPLLFRIHDTPSDEKLAALRDFLASIDIKLSRDGNLRPATFNGILSRVADTEHAGLVNEVVLRTQAQAEYSPHNIGHFGLNLRRYAHFTSPIRRYADLIVHRGLVRALGLGEGGLPDGMEERLELIGAEISAAERRAMAAERDTVDRLVAHWLADHVGADFTGRISGVTRAGLFVRLQESGADGFIPAATLGDDYFRFDEATLSMTGDRTGETHRLGDIVEVRLAEAAPLAGALRFELLTEGRYLKGKGRAPGKGKRPAGRARAGNARIGKTRAGKAAGKPPGKPKRRS